MNNPLLNTGAALLLAPIFYKIFEIILKKEDAEYTKVVPYKSLYLLCFLPTILYSLVMTYKFGFALYSVLHMVIGVGLAWSCITDLRIRELPDSVTLIFFIISLKMFFDQPMDTWLMKILTVVVTTVILYIIWKFVGGLGFGDIKLLIPILLSLSPSMYLGFFTNSIFIAFIYAIMILIKTKKDPEADKTFAFGPFLIWGYYLTLFGISILEMIVNLIV